MALRRTHRQRLSFTGTALALVFAGACRAHERPAAVADSAAVKPADSLVVKSGAGVEVWFTLARTGRSADGISCVERALEIRRGGSHIRVPLLYTGALPVLLNDSTLRAQLWNHCRPVDAYLVDLRTGQPIPDRREGAS
jgi:hypothetical protein